MVRCGWNFRLSLGKPIFLSALVIADCRRHNASAPRSTPIHTVRGRRRSGKAPVPPNDISKGANGADAWATARPTFGNSASGTSPRKLSVRCMLAGSTHFTGTSQTRSRSIRSAARRRVSDETSTAMKVRVLFMTISVAFVTRELASACKPARRKHAPMPDHHNLPRSTIQISAGLVTCEFDSAPRYAETTIFRRDSWIAVAFTYLGTSAHVACSGNPWARAAHHHLPEESPNARTSFCIVRYVAKRRRVLTGDIRFMPLPER